MKKYLAIKIEKVNEAAEIPEYQTPGSSGMDLKATEDVILWPFVPTLIKTGFKIEIPEGYEGQIRARSGLALKNGIILANGIGTIDCFSQHMLIKTANGDKKISEITVNDVILSFNVEKLEIEKDVINTIIYKGGRKTIIFELENDKNLEVTENALVFTNNGLKLANEVNENDSLLYF